MSLSSIIRAVRNGSAGKPRAETGDTEDEMEDDPKPVDGEETPPEEDAEDDEQTPDAEDTPPEDEPDGGETNMSAAERRAFAAGRTAERDRIGRIMGAAEADANPQLAAHLAFATATPSKDAVATLKAGASGIGAGRSSLDERMNRAPNPQVGGMGGRSAAKDQPSRIFARSMAAIEAKKNRAGKR